MTRETKIGLLVGLAFIIVIGILLSDHMRSTNEPAVAALSGAGNNVRDGVTTPGGGGEPAVSANQNAPTNAPRQGVPTRADLNAAQQPAPPAQPPVSIVQVNGGQPGNPITIRQQPGAVPNALSDGRPTGGNVESPVVPTPPANPHDLIANHPEDFAPVNPNPRPAPSDRNATPVVPPKMYTAEAGDSVSRMAARLLGGNTKTNRELIIKANPSLQSEGNVVQVGKTYVIPVTKPGAAVPLGTAPSPTTPTTPRPAPAAVASGDPKPGSFVWYTIKENDNLWKIANDQLGSGNAWTALKDANRDILKGGDNVRVNMRIRVPNKPTASAAAN